MRPLDDAALHEHLERRVRTSPMTKDERNAMLATVGSDRATRHGMSASALKFGRWVGAAAAALSLILVVAVVLKLPNDQGPSSSVPPASSAGAISSASSVGPTEEPISGPEIFSAQGLSDMIGGERIGDVVLARAQIGHMMTGPIGCGPPEPCHGSVLADVSGRNVVAVGWRTALEGEGTRYADDSGVHWLTYVGVPAEPGMFAFRILADAAEYLGPVVETADGEIVWNVGEVNSGEHDDLTDDLYAVEGWLVMTPPVPCPAPRDYGLDTSTAYWCGGSFVTQARVETYSSEHGVLLDPGGLHVQGSAYDDFAPTPATDPQRGGEPRFGTYLVRSAGCHPVTAGECPVWTLVSRLDDFTPPAPDSQFPRDIDGEQVLTVDEATTLITSSDSAEPFLVGGWVVSSSADCFLPPDFPDTPLLAACGDGFHILSHSPDRTAESLLGGLRLVIDEGIGAFPTGMDPTVLRVHAHDPRAADCPANYRARCEAAIVVDAVVWPAPSSTPSPTATDLRWSVEPFLPGTEAVPIAIAEVGGRLIVTGNDRDGPAAWYSDDDGATWVRASIEDDGEGRLRGLGSVVGNEERLLSLGWVYLGGGADANRRSVLWASTDLGATWEQIQGQSVPPRIHDLVVGGPGFVAVGNANPSNSGLPDIDPPHAGIWVSVDGIGWKPIPDEASFQLSRMNEISVRDGLLVAAGSYRVGADDRPAIWRSSDGRQWSRVELSTSPGSAQSIAGGPDGFVAVGSSTAGGQMATAWASPDGTSWTAEILDTMVGRFATEVAMNDVGFVATGHSWTEISGFAWVFDVGGVIQQQEIGAVVWDLVGMRDQFVGVGDCGPTAYCFSNYLIIGRP